MRDALRAGIAAIVLLTVSAASADRGPADLAASDMHVAEARRLRSRGRIMDACSEYVAADRDYPRAWVLVELADCYDAAGFPGTAERVLKRARELEGSEQSRPIAKRHRDIQHGARLRIVLDPSVDRDKVTVTIDGSPAANLDGEPQALDPLLPTVHAHTVVASAPGFKPQRIEVPIGPNELKTVKIGPLERDNSKAPKLDVPVVPTVQQSDGLGATFSLSFFGGSYKIPEVDKRGELLVITPRVAVSYKRFGVFARQAWAHTFEIPFAPPGTSRSVLGAPTFGVSYYQPLPKTMGLAFSVDASPPVLGRPSDNFEGFTRGIANFSGSGGFGDRQLGVGLAVVWLARPTDALNLSLVNVGIASIPAPTDGRDSFYGSIHIGRVSYNVLPWLAPFLGMSLFRNWTPDADRAESFNVEGGTTFVINKHVQTSLRGQYSVFGSQVDLSPILGEASVTVTF